MTISSTTNRVSATGNGVTTSFSFPYFVIAAADLKVYQNGTLKTITTHYTLSGSAPYTSGTNVQFVSAPASGDEIVILRDPAITQAVDLVDNDPFDPDDAVERPLDKLTMIAQRLSDRIDRSFHLADSDVSGASTVIPEPEANKFIAWDDDAEALINVDLDDLLTIAGSANFVSELFSGDGSDTTFELSATPGSAANCAVYISGVRQRPTTDYTVSGTTLTFLSAPASGTNNILVIRGTTLAVGSAASENVTYDPGRTSDVDYNVRDKLRQYVSVKDFGAVGDDSNDDTAAFLAAINSCTSDEVLFVPPGTYKVTSMPTIGQSSKGARIVGIGKPTIKFYTLGSSSDCLTLSGASMRQVELRNLIIDCNDVGRDGIVLTASDTPIIDNVHIANCVRDSFAISCSGTDYVENGEFDISIQDAGRHAVRQQLAGSGGAFINEILWRKLEIRRVGQVTAGARSMLCTSTATDPASKFSNQIFLKSNVDAQYPGSGALPSTNVFEVDSGSIENWRFMSGGWENTGAGTLTGGYAWAVSGTGVWNGLTVDSMITNSGYGNLGVHASITAVWNHDFSFGFTRAHGPLKLPTNPAFRAYVTANSSSDKTGDGTAYNVAAYTEEYDKASNFNAATGLFTAPVAGLYQFDGRVSYGPVGGSHTVATLGVDKNGGTVYQISHQQDAGVDADGSGNLAISGSITLELAANDTIALRLTVSGSTKTVGVYLGTANSWFTGRMVG